MNPEITPPNSSESTPTRKRAGSDQSTSPSKKFKCEPCNKLFTEHKSLLRHQRENRRHRQQPLQFNPAFVCEQCHKTFARAHDLERHDREQHGAGKIACPGCGKHVRPNTPHKNLAGALCRKQEHVPVREAIVARRERRVDLSCTLAIPDAAQDSVMKSLTQQLSCASIEKEPRDAAVCRRQQVRGKGDNRKFPCGLCGTKFEIDEAHILLKHLRSHFKTFDGKPSRYRCHICEISFVHESDLKRHALSAARGDCGFAFEHKSPCPGHHSPGRRNIQSSGLETDDDRFDFSYRLRTWEHAQLKGFGLSVKDIEPSLNRKQNPEAFVRSEAHARSAMKHDYRQTRSTASRLEWGMVYKVGTDTAILTDTYRDRLHESDMFQIDHATEPDTTSPPLPDLDPEWDEMIVSSHELAQTFLNQAASSGDVEQARLAISSGAILNHSALPEFTALHIAARLGAQNMISYLLDAGASVHPPGYTFTSPLMVAVICGHLDAAQVLINHGALEESKRRGENLFHAVLSTCEGSFVADQPAYRDTYFSKVDYYYKENVWSRLRFLVDNGASVDVWPLGHRRTALQLAATLGDFDLLNFLLEHSQNLQDETRDNLVSILVKKRNYLVVERLIYWRNFATREEHVISSIMDEAPLETITLFFDHCVDAGSAGFGGSVLATAIEWYSIGAFELVSLLLDSGAKIEWSYCSAPLPNCHPLLVAVSKGLLNVTAHLLSYRPGLSKNIGSHTVGARALYLAAQRGNNGIMKLLIKSGAEVCDDKFGDCDVPNTMLYAAVQCGSLECSQLLIQNGASLEIKCTNGETALMRAARQGHKAIVDLLISAGADVHARDSARHTALCDADTEFVGIDGDDPFRAETYARLVEAGATLKDCRECSKSSDDQ